VKVIDLSSFSVYDMPQSSTINVMGTYNLESLITGAGSNVLPLISVTPGVILNVLAASETVAVLPSHATLYLKASTTMRSGAI